MTAQLLNENKKALQFLHHAKGFDFNKPYNIVRKIGRFTSRTVSACIPDGHVAAMFVKPVKTLYRRSNELYYVEIGACGSFDPLRIQNVNYWNYSDIGYLFSKGDFENIRKNETEYIYIVTQALEYIIPRTEPKLDLFGRLIMSDPRKCGDGKGNSYVGSVYLKNRYENMRPMQYNTWGKPATVADVIDKSGYLVSLRREELARRAAMLRKERAAQKAKEADFSKEYEELMQELTTAKIALAAAVLAASASGDFYAISRTARNLQTAADYLDRFRKWKNAGKYGSVDSIKYDLTKAREYIEKGDN